VAGFAPAEMQTSDDAAPSPVRERRNSSAPSSQRHVGTVGITSRPPRIRPQRSVTHWMGPTVGGKWKKTYPSATAQLVSIRKRVLAPATKAGRFPQQAVHVQGEWSMFASEVVCRGWQLVHARPTSQTSSLNYLPNWRLPYTHTPTPSYL